MCGYIYCLHASRHVTKKAAQSFLKHRLSMMQETRNSQIFTQQSCRCLSLKYVSFWLILASDNCAFPLGVRLCCS